MSRDMLAMLAMLDEAGSGIASATYDIVGLPPISLKRDKTHAPVRHLISCPRAGPAIGALPNSRMMP